MNTMLGQMREVGRAQFPSPFYDRSYKLPPHYPPMSRVRESILDPLGIFTYGAVASAGDKALSNDLESLTASFMTRAVAWKWDHPMYLVTPALSNLLLHTDRLDQPNVDKDSKPPFQAGYFVLPVNTLGLADGSYVTVISYAVLGFEDFTGLPVSPPRSFEKERRFYVTIEMDSGVAYYSKIPISPDGVVANSEDQPYEDDSSLWMTREGLGNRPPTAPPKFVVADGPILIGSVGNFLLSLFTFMNMERAKSSIEPQRLTGTAKPKRKGFPGREFWNPAIIGTGFKPTGIATQGSHASPHTHIRRGHWRWQHFGPKRGEKKRLWIEPTVVMGKGPV